MLNNVNAPGPAQTGPASASAPPENAGLANAGAQVLGDEVVDVDFDSVFADAMDELSASLSERTQEKKLRERAFQNADEELALLREQLKEMLAAMAGDGSQEKPAHVVNQEIQALTQRIIKNPSLARQYVGEYSGNPTEQYLLLRDLDQRAEVGEFKNLLQDAGRAAIREAASEIFAEHSGRILADVNTFAATNALQKAEATSLRSIYKDSVLGEASLAQTLSKLVQAADGGRPEDFLRVHESMVKALGLDIAAARPSTDKVKLQAMASDLFHLSTISTVIQQCDNLAKTLADRFSIEPAPGTQMASELIAVTGERWVDGARFGRLTDKFGFQSPAECAVQFLQSIRHVMSSMPVQVFATPEARGSILDAAQSALDSAINREEGAA
jgi:type III secretion protein W